MRKSLTMRLPILALIAVSLLIGGVASAQTKVDVSGQVRFRKEVDRRNFNSFYKAETYSFLRTRININAEVNENAHAFIQFQDSRIIGDKTVFGGNQSGGLNDGKNVDIHQAYLKLDNIFGEGWGAQLGRFEVNFGNQRVFGAVGWDNVGRSWEGASHWYTNSSVKITGWALKAVEAMNMTGNRDFDLYGYSVDLKKANASFFAILERNAKRDVAGKKMLNRFNLGGFVKHTKNQLDFMANAVYQGGTISVGALELLDIKAYMVTGEVGFTFSGKSKARIAVAADLSSGDDNATDTDFKSYNNLYYTGHKFRGYMDYFLSSSTAGLMDLILRSQFNPTNGWIVKADVHYFKTAQDYLDFNSVMTSDVGIEVDVTVVTTRVKGAKIVNGVSFFVPKDSFAGFANNQSGIWGYSQVIVNF